ncbi:hypothetical protein [Rhizobium sp. CC-YZS058]|nr:hypothetical protein [Rhizobium sp. CC-YZS058]MEA3534877.1 hypothetical protein [Rhizobium sp. CC-YZS058]
MRFIFVGMIVSVLSILALKYANNDIGQAVPLMNPQAVSSL